MKNSKNKKDDVEEKLKNIFESVDLSAISLEEFCTMMKKIMKI